MLVARRPYEPSFFKKKKKRWLPAASAAQVSQLLGWCITTTRCEDLIQILVLAVNNDTGTRDDVHLDDAIFHAIYRNSKYC